MIADGLGNGTRRSSRHRRHVELLAESDQIEDRKSTRLNSSHSQISYAVFCLKKKKQLVTEYITKKHLFNLPYPVNAATIYVLIHSRPNNSVDLFTCTLGHPTTTLDARIHSS